MALIDIEYGSLASSETMNKNFTYLDDKIAETSDSIMTSISSILSNIATINTRINDITENLDDSIKALNSTIEEYKTKTKLLVNKSSMVPNWESCSSIEISTDTKYTVPSNGYLLLLARSSEKGEIIINKQTFKFKDVASAYDYSGQLISIPVFEGDMVSSSIVFNNVYFLPNKEINLENF